MQVSGKAVARVNGVELNDRELVREMFTIFPYAQQHNGFPKQLEPEIRRGALQMIIFDELVYQEAKRRNVSIPAADMVKAERNSRLSSQPALHTTRSCRARRTAQNRPCATKFAGPS